MIPLTHVRPSWAPGGVRPRASAQLAQAQVPAPEWNTSIGRVLSDTATVIPLGALAYRLKKMGMKIPSGFMWMTAGAVSIKTVYDLLVALGVDIRLGVLEGATAQVITNVLGLGSSGYMALGSKKAATKMAWSFLSGGQAVKLAQNVASM